MSSHLAVAFFINRGDQPQEESALITATGLQSFPDAPDESGLWAGMTCWPSVEWLPYHALVTLRFWASDFLAIVENEKHVPVEEDGAYRLALAFRDACDMLQPDAAFVVTHRHQAEREWIRGREWLVLSHDVDALANERVGLLYLNQAFGVPHPSLISDRDQIPCRSGLLLFSDRGASRWM